MRSYVLQMLNRSGSTADLEVAYKWPVRSKNDEAALGGVSRLLANWPDEEAANARLFRSNGTAVAAWDMRRIHGRPFDRSAKRHP